MTKAKPVKVSDLTDIQDIPLSLIARAQMRGNRVVHMVTKEGRRAGIRMFYITRCNRALSRFNCIYVLVDATTTPGYRPCARCHSPDDFRAAHAAQVERFNKGTELRAGE